MSNLQGDVYEASRSIDVPEDKALKAASALSRRDENVGALKSDVVLLEGMVGTGVGVSLLLLGSVLTMGSKPGDMNGALAQIARGLHRRRGGPSPSVVSWHPSTEGPSRGRRSFRVFRSGAGAAAAQ